MDAVQAITNPHGISVFGSSIVRTEADLVSLSFGVHALNDRPGRSFAEVRQKAQAVRAFLTGEQIRDVGSSRVSLSSEFAYQEGEHRFIGYAAKIDFNVLLRELERMEDILSGVIDAGATSISSVEFQTSQLKKVRADARKRAIVAAWEKAEVYCQAAGVILGKVMHIEDINPDRLRGREGHLVREPVVDDEGPIQAIDPGSISVGAAVMVVFRIDEQ